MENFKFKFYFIGTVVLTLVSSFIGGFDIWVRTLIVMMIGDFIFGFAKAWCGGKINSKALRNGGLRKILTLLLVGLSNQLGLAFGIEEMRTVVISYYLLMEFVSIMEHTAELEIPLPKYVKTLVNYLIDKLELKEVE